MRELSQQWSKGQEKQNIKGPVGVREDRDGEVWETIHILSPSVH